MLTRMARLLTRMARLLTRMACMLTRMTRWLAYYTHSSLLKKRSFKRDLKLSINFACLK